MRPSPLPESNYYLVFTKANSPSDPYASKTKLRPLSGTLSSLHRSILLQDLILPTENICTRAPDNPRVAERTVRHRNRYPFHGVIDDVVIPHRQYRVGARMPAKQYRQHHVI